MDARSNVASIRKVRANVAFRVFGASWRHRFGYRGNTEQDYRPLPLSQFVLESRTYLS